MSRDNRWVDWLAFLFLLGALYVAAVRLQATHWTDHLEAVEFITLLAVLLGFLIGVSQFSSKTAFWLGTAFTLFILPWRLGVLLEAYEGWIPRLLGLFSRLGFSSTLFFEKKPVSDPLLFLTLMYVLFWVVSLTASYQLVRNGNPWKPLLVMVITYLAVDYYPPAVKFHNFFSGLFILLIVLLVGRIYYLRSQKKWQMRGVLVDYDTGYDLGRNMIISGLVIVLVAWNIPVFADMFKSGTKANQTMEAIWEPIRESLSNAFASLTRPPEASVQEFFGSKLGLGVGARLGDETLFTVAVSTSRSKTMRFYWRGRSYDTYRNGEWTSTITDKYEVIPREWPIKNPDWRSRKTIDFAYDLKTPTSRMIFLPSYPLYVSRRVDLVGIQDDATNVWDPTTVLSQIPIQAGETMEATAWVSDPSENQLNAAGTNYPTWVRQHYLLLPDNFSPKIRALAKEVTADAATPYEKTQAVTRYLRENITYQETINTLPEGKDPIEWLLFESKTGFCNYYASAEVLMLRSLGVPARLVAGFAEGEAALEEGVYRVRVKDSHAWPEVFFPDYGWIEFEPTSSQPEGEFWVEENKNNNNDLEAQGHQYPDIDAEGRQEARERLNRMDKMEEIDLPEERPSYLWVYLLLLAVGLAALAGLIWRWALRHPEWKGLSFPLVLEDIFRGRGWRTPRPIRFWARRTEMSTIEKYFMEVGWMARLSGAPFQPTQTPAEQVKQLIKMMPELESSANSLLAEYQRAIYSPEEGDLVKARSAYVDLWKQVIKSAVVRVVEV